MSTSMNALEVLQNRVSCPQLQAPAPSGEVLANIKQAAMRAADHGLMRPWRFLVIENDSLDRLGELFVKAKEATAVAMPDALRQRVIEKPKRAPMIMVAIANCQPNPKVPEVEQLISAGCAVQNMLNAAFAQQVGAMWRTGEMAYSQIVREGLGLSDNEQIVGFLYLGTRKTELKPLPELDTEQFFSSW